MGAVLKQIEDYVRSLGLDAYLVGGAVRDELLGRDSKDADFVVPGVDTQGLRSLLEPHGRVEDLVVADRLVGVRFRPRDREVRALVPGGIEFAPPRREVSTGPGRHDFAIEADASLPVEKDMERRDFTVNAIARRLATGEYVDPVGGREDLRRGVLRAVSPQSFAEDPLRLVRGLRLVSQLGLEPDESTLRQMREEAEAVRLVSPERIGGGLAADGMGELSKLLLGAHPARALRLARDTGVLVELLPEFAPVLGYEQDSRRQHLTLDEHIFETVQHAADGGASLEVRLAVLLHDLGKPEAEQTGGDHAALGAEIARSVLRRLRYPARLQAYVGRLVHEHGFSEPTAPEPLDARRFLARHGERLAFDLLDHKAADLAAKRPDADEVAGLARLRELVEAERRQPHALAHLAVDGADLIAIGFREGPELGRVLQLLLREVVEEPERNTREWLLERAALELDVR
jgi:tRNA nucleotidyltransferase (CCA-adding enzyme)